MLSGRLASSRNSRFRSRFWFSTRRVRPGSSLPVLLPPCCHQREAISVVPTRFQARHAPQTPICRAIASAKQATCPQTVELRSRAKRHSVGPQRVTSTSVGDKD